MLGSVAHDGISPQRMVESLRTGSRWSELYRLVCNEGVALLAGLAHLPAAPLGDGAFANQAAR
jgi:hypothetical protein